MKRILLFILIITSLQICSQNKRIRILSSKISTFDEKRWPGATILIGNVKVAHEGATLDCKRALLYREQNIFKAIGEVVIEQGDSIIQYSDFANYDANTKIAKSWGNVEVNDKEMKLTTDTLYFDRTNQKLFYPAKGTIKDKKNTLKSDRGTYYLEEKKFSAKTQVNVVNPDNELNSDHLDYYTNTNLAYVYGPSTIFNFKDSTKVYAEKGFFDTNTDISYFVKNAKLFLKDRTVAADSLYYDKRKGFASANNRIKVIDTVQKMVIKGNYAEIFELKDSMFIIKKPVAISIMEKDSLYIHGDTILVTGKKDNRIVRTYHHVKIFKSNLQGKCDSIHSNQATGLTRMFKNPVLWSGKSQITGDSIQFTTHKETNKLDSLRVLKNAFVIENDSLDPKNFNQIKGRDIFGKFENNNLKVLLVKGNAESLYYNRNEETLKLETVTKEIASDIEFLLENNEVIQTKYFKKSEGKTYPPSDFPSDKAKFTGFIWREDEQPKVMEDIFKKETQKVKPKTKVNSALQKAKKQLFKENKKRDLQQLKEEEE
ncbi:OstA-like protein [Tenacibaculum sp. ZS6-P6]|uniref:OstA-like protein n=1 Tax=Tenacibaculum sp. ZS6-P6 TaxID=3447503 RepID=UPI003F98F3B6